MWRFDVLKRWRNATMTLGPVNMCISRREARRPTPNYQLTMRIVALHSPDSTYHSRLSESSRRFQTRVKDTAVLVAHSSCLESRNSRRLRLFAIWYIRGARSVSGPTPARAWVFRRIYSSSSSHPRALRSRGSQCYHVISRCATFPGVIKHLQVRSPMI